METETTETGIETLWANTMFVILAEGEDLFAMLQRGPTVALTVIGLAEWYTGVKEIDIGNLRKTGILNGSDITEWVRNSVRYMNIEDIPMVVHNTEFGEFRISIDTWDIFVEELEQVLEEMIFLEGGLSMIGINVD